MRSSTRRSCTEPRRRKRVRLEDLQQLALHGRMRCRRSRRGTACRGRPSRSGPGRRCLAPVKAPRSWPNSSLSTKSRRQRRAVEVDERAAPRASLWTCSERASTPLPVPVSPWMRTGRRLSTMRTACCSSRRMASLVPRNGDSAASAREPAWPPGLLEHAASRSARARPRARPGARA